MAFLKDKYENKKKININDIPPWKKQNYEKNYINKNFNRNFVKQS